MRHQDTVKPAIWRVLDDPVTMRGCIAGLSACAYGESMSPGERFKTFVRDIARWPDGERVSLPQAALLFQAQPVISAQLSTRLLNWNWGTPQPITSDPFVHEPGIPDVDFSKVQHVNRIRPVNPSCAV